jgi:hypothetical protein
MIRVIVCGSRGWHDRQRIADRLYDLALEHEQSGCMVVHGNAKGADRIAGEEAGKLGLPVEAHPADWNRYGRRAGPIRNAEMAKAGADLCIAFYDGQSAGTKHMIAAARQHDIPVEIILEKGEPMAMQEGISMSDSIRARPVWARWLRRQEFDRKGLLPPATDAEKHDAILILGETRFRTYAFGDELHIEATNILNEGI